MSMQSERPLVSAGEAARQLGIPPYALYRLVYAGRIPAEQLPAELWHRKDRRRLRFDVEAVRAALERDR